MANSISGKQELELETMAGGSITEVIGGAAAVVLTILGLLNVQPLFMLSIAAIAAGGGLMLQGSAIAAEYSGIISRIGEEQLHRMRLGGGLGIEITTGAAGVALGILSLLGLIPHILLPVSAIVLGCGLAFSSTTISRLNRVKIMHAGMQPNVQEVARGAVDSASGAQILIGLGAATLGILSIIGISVMTLTMIALLAVGFSILITGLSLSGRAFKAIKY